VTRIGRFIGGQFDPLTEFGGPSIQDHGIGLVNGVNFVGEVVPPQATVVAHRRSIPLFGLGLVDAVPDFEFQAIAAEEQSSDPTTAGVLSTVVDPSTGATRMGKFGWKAQEATLFDFVGDALVNELGVTTPLFPIENCPQGNCDLLSANPALTNPNSPDDTIVQQLTDFITFLAPPPRGTVGADEQAGQVLFSQIGCTSCHTPTLSTGPNVVAVFNDVTFSPYSDFLLHDMGSLGDGVVQNQAGPTLMRTAPLWGLRFERTFLHDGRAVTIPSAILAHDGQGKGASTRFAALSAAQQAQLIAFLNSL
jgi:CxxC motif-containing protein (DUF1111 family)